jgi:SRSO17 transposase
VRGEVLKYAREHLGEDGVVAVDETGFLKKGQKSAGVARQYTGTAGRIENAQVGVFLAYVTPRGHTLIDRELYLPEHWLEDPERCRKAGIGEQVVFRTKPELARLRFLEEHQLRYVLATASNTHVERGSSKQPVAEVLQELNAEDWTTLSAGEGSKGPRLYDWARMKVNSGPAPQQRWLLARRSLKDATDVAYYLVHAPANIWC